MSLININDYENASFAVEALVKKIIPQTDAQIKVNINKGNADSLSIYGMVAFWIVRNTKGNFIEYNISVDTTLPVIQMVNRTRIDLNDLLNDEDEAARFISTIGEYCLSNVTVEHFGCCSHFIDCSDAKECLYKDRIEYRGCSYRENLEAGRIFYGKNRNQFFRSAKI